MSYLLIWDIDGTLIHSNGVGRIAMDRAFEDLYGIKDAFKNISMLGMLDYNIMREVYRYHQVDCVDMEVYFDRYCNYLEDVVANLQFILPIPGILGLLKLLDSKDGFYNVLGTGNIERAARIKLEKDDMNKFFPVGGFSCSEAQRWQVIAKAANLAREYFGVNFENEHIFVIGDTPKDVECGKILGTKTIALANKFYSPAQLFKCGADHVLESYENTTEFFSIFR